MPVCAAVCGLDLLDNYSEIEWFDPTGLDGDAFGYYDINNLPSKTLLLERRVDSQIRPFFELAVAKLGRSRTNLS
jgi:hypothetical protein